MIYSRPETIDVPGLVYIAGKLAGWAKNDYDRVGGRSHNNNYILDNNSNNIRVI